MFLDELPTEGVDNVDLSDTGAGRAAAAHTWRETTRSEGWYDAGFARSPKPTSVTPGAAALIAASESVDYGVGMIVNHATHGRGRVTEVSGHGALRKVKVRFADGERAFIAAKAKMTIVQE